MPPHESQLGLSVWWFGGGPKMFQVLEIPIESRSVQNQKTSSGIARIAEGMGFAGGYQDEQPSFTSEDFVCDPKFYDPI